MDLNYLFFSVFCLETDPFHIKFERLLVLVCFQKLRSNRFSNEVYKGSCNQDLEEKQRINENKDVAALSLSFL